MRYEVRVITDLQKKVVLGRAQLATDDAVAAKNYADRHGTEETYGLAISDTVNQTVDLGDRVITREAYLIDDGESK